MFALRAGGIQRLISSVAFLYCSAVVRFTPIDKNRDRAPPPRLPWRAAKGPPWRAVVAVAEAAGAGASRRRLPLLPLRCVTCWPAVAVLFLPCHTSAVVRWQEEETPEDGFNANACREFLTSSYQKGIERLNDAAQPHTQQYQSQAKVWGNALLQPTSDDFGAKLSAALHAFRERPPS